MSSNYIHHCYHCEEKIKNFIKSQYGKLPQKIYDKLNNATNIDDVLKFLPDELINGDTDRIQNSELDYEFVEDWGEGININKDGNLYISISCSCDLCGLEFNYKIILPPNSTTQIINKCNEELK